MNKLLRILILKDRENDLGLLLTHLEKGGYKVTHEQVETAEEMKNALEQSTWDIVLGEVRARRELKESEEMFLRSQKMEAFGHLAGGVAHDFNNILAVIHMCSESLASRLSKQGLSFKELEQIRLAGQRAAKLTRQLLAFSRKQVLAPRVLDLNEIVESMGEMLQRLIAENIQLVMDLDPDLDNVRVDPGQMEQVIMNLAVNARDSMPEGGKFTITTRNIKVAEDLSLDVPPGNYVLISAEDTGCGIDRNVLHRIFEPFFTTKGPNGGTGLGLSTVYGIVKQSGGFITVDSGKDVGTTFKIFLPKVNLPLDAVTESASDRRTTCRKGRILLVEDDKDLRDVLRRSLETQGHKVTAPNSSEEALLLVKNGSCDIDLVITDMVMPGISGFKLAEEILEINSEARVLFISGYIYSNEEESAFRVKNSHFLLKPFSSEALFEKVREALMNSGTLE